MLRRRAQGVSRLAAFQRPPSGLAFTRPSTTAGLMGSVDFSCPVTYPSSCQRALFRSRMCFRQVLLRSPWRVRCSHQLISGSSDPACQGAACMDDRAGGMGLIFRTADWQTPICDADIQPHIRPARHTRLGVSELSAMSTLSHKGRSLLARLVAEYDRWLLATHLRPAITGRDELCHQAFAVAAFERIDAHLLTIGKLDTQQP